MYPCRDFMPTKVNALIDYLSEVYSADKYWDRGFTAAPGATSTSKSIGKSVDRDSKVVRLA